MRFRDLVLFTIIAALGAIPAPAQSGEATAFVGIAQVREGGLGSIGLAAQEIRLDHGLRAGVRLGLNAGALTGHELTYTFERHDLQIAGVKESTALTQQFYYNFVFHATPRAAAVRPFVTGGLGYANFSPGSGGVFRDAAGANKLGYNYGGGLKVKMSRRLGLRFDVRDHVTGKPNFLDLPGVNGRLHSIEYSAGFSLLL